MKALVCGAALAVPLTALADATVRVELRGPDGKPAEGTVVLSHDGKRHTCETEGGKCAMPGVAGGLYTVSVEQKGKESPKAREVMIPPSGEVSLIVRGG